MARKSVPDFYGYCANYFGPFYSVEKDGEIEAKRAGNMFWRVDCAKCKNKPAAEPCETNTKTEAITDSEGAANIVKKFYPGCRYTLERKQLNGNGIEEVIRTEKAVEMIEMPRLEGETVRDPRYSVHCPFCKEELSPELFKVDRRDYEGVRCLSCLKHFVKPIKRYRKFPWFLLNWR